MSKKNKKKETLGTIASIQTILERYPVLISNDTVGNTSLTFTFDLLEMLGVGPDEILEWLSKLLSEKNGWLDILEDAIKAFLITTFKDTYTCSINPRLPSSTMRTVYPDASEVGTVGTGITVNLDDIDAFGILNHCPVTEQGSVFYFDTNPSNGYNSLNVYSSMDFNAYLWYVINRGKNPPEHNSVWDNRVDYIKKFDLVGTFGESSMKGRFLNATGRRSPIFRVPGVGSKKEILSCAYAESGVTEQNKLVVYINYDRYFGQFGNKTVFEFNFDYITSLKLFDSKTLVAQIINAVAGISTSLNANLSFNQQLISAQLKEIVKRVMMTEDGSPEDCYYKFSNEEYDKLLREADIRQKTTGENYKALNDEIISEVSKINNASADDEDKVIYSVFKSVSQDISTYNSDDKYEVSLGIDVIRKFLEETVFQLTLQVLSPKIMLLYAINDKVLDPNGSGINGAIEFFKKFENLIVSLIKQIFSLIMEYLAEFLIGQLKEIIYLFIEKLLLEKIGYYMLLIEQLISTCTAGVGNISLSFNGRRNNPLSIENVIGADIIPSKDTPTEEC